MRKNVLLLAALGLMASCSNSVDELNIMNGDEKNSINLPSRAQKNFYLSEDEEEEARKDLAKSDIDLNFLNENGGSVFSFNSKKDSLEDFEPFITTIFERVAEELDDLVFTQFFAKEIEFLVFNNVKLKGDFKNDAEGINEFMKDINELALELFIKNGIVTDSTEELNVIGLGAYMESVMEDGTDSDEKD